MMRRRSASVRAAIGVGCLGLTLFVASCVRNCDEESCVRAFHQGDRLEVTLLAASSTAVDASTCLGQFGFGAGSKLVIALDEATKTMTGCTGYILGLEIPGFTLSRNNIPNDQRVFGADFDAVFNGVCKGLLRFDLFVDGEFGELPIGPDTGAPFPIARAQIYVDFPEADGCPRTWCNGIFAVSIDRALPREVDSGDEQE